MLHACPFTAVWTTEERLNFFAIGLRKGLHTISRGSQISLALPRCGCHRFNDRLLTFPVFMGQSDIYATRR